MFEWLVAQAVRKCEEGQRSTNSFSKIKLFLVGLCMVYLGDIILISWDVGLDMHTVAETWRRVWGDVKNFLGQRFLNDGFFREIIPIFEAEISDDLYFSHRPYFLDFP